LSLLPLRRRRAHFFAANNAIHRKGEFKVKLDVLSVDKFVETNQCPRVTNPIFFDAGLVPTPDGLLSYESFGRYGSYDRRTIFGYIDLGRKMLHPTVYKALVAVDKRIARIADGSLRVSMKGGELVEDQENGETGLDFLVANLRKINFKSTGSAVRDERLDMVRLLKDDEIWITKWPVSPAFYRDVNMAKAQQGQISVGELNQLYARIISLSVSASRPGGGFSFVGDATTAQLQIAIMDSYNYFVGDGGRLPKKSGIIHRGILGKAVDYACRSVISAPRYNADGPEKQKIDFRHTGIPLSQVCVLYFPFMVYEIGAFIQDIFGDRKYVTDEKGNHYSMKDPMGQFTLPVIKKMISLYIKAPQHRFDVLTIKTDDGVVRDMDIYREDLGRQFTLIDLLYICAIKAIERKHVYVTRYPIEHHQNIHTTLIHVLSTRKTKEQMLGNRLFEDYPEVFPDYPEEGSGFSDTVQMSNSYLTAIGGDYDGDTVSLRGVYTQEANQEAGQIMESARNIMDSSGKSVRRLMGEAVLSIYCMTEG
jgi:hypothetical protein